jgi:hypothetical protein
MGQKITGKEPIITPGWIIMPYKYSVGALASKFFVELRDNKRIMGVRCSECNRVIVPPRSVCNKCFSKLHECVELDSKGTLLTYTIVHYTPSCEWLKPPFAYGVIQLDGADTGFTHVLGEVDLENIKIGMRVEAVFKDKRQGNILDIQYFRPLASSL